METVGTEQAFGKQWFIVTFYCCIILNYSTLSHVLYTNLILHDGNTSNFLRVQYYQILLKSVNIWPSNHRNKRIMNVHINYLDKRCKLLTTKCYQPSEHWWQFPDVSWPCHARTPTSPADTCLPVPSTCRNTGQQKISKCNTRFFSNTAAQNRKYCCEHGDTGRTNFSTWRPFRPLLVVSLTSSMWFSINILTT